MSNKREINLPPIIALMGYGVCYDGDAVFMFLMHFFIFAGSF